MKLADVSLSGVQTIEECGHDLYEAEELKACLTAAVKSPAYQQSAVTAAKVFSEITGNETPSENLNRFLNGWRSTHVTALYVSGLMIRIQREAFGAMCRGESAKAELLSEAAYHIGEIIAEDTGVEGSNHNNLFDRFAKGVSGSDNWKSDIYAVPSCMEFRHYIERQRTRAPIEDGILATAASENWNVGEYTSFSEIVPEWIENRTNCGKIEAKRIAAYVTVHSGDTELNHFTHALKAWQLYCAANGQEARPEKAQAIFVEYAEKVGAAFGGLAQVAGLENMPVTTPAPRKAFERAI